MIPQLTKILIKSTSSPDYVRQFGSGVLEIFRLADNFITRITLAPDWRWSKDFAPQVVDSNSLARHTVYVLSGRLTLMLEDGTSRDLSPGDMAVIPSIDDAYVGGPEACVLLTFANVADGCVDQISLCGQGATWEPED